MTTRDDGHLWHITTRPLGDGTYEHVAWAAGVASGPFHDREKALEWICTRVAEDHESAINFIASDPLLWEQFDSVNRADSPWQVRFSFRVNDDLPHGNSAYTAGSDLRQWRTPLLGFVARVIEVMEAHENRHMVSVAPGDVFIDRSKVGTSANVYAVPALRACLKCGFAVGHCTCENSK